MKQHPRIHPAGTFFGTGDERASEDDRAYFAAHRLLTTRIRRAFPGEGPKPGVPADTLVIVTQLAPGVRVRRWVLPNTSIGAN